MGACRLQFKKGHLSPPVHASINKEVFEIGDALKKIFAASFQVLPFLYTHMVSLSCTVYLLGSAFLRGCAFTPEADLPGGLIIPIVYVVLTNLTIYGLLCVGDTLMEDVKRTMKLKKIQLLLSILNTISNLCSQGLKGNQNIAEN